MSMFWNPFEILGLPTRRDLTDAQVDAAWRAIAVATHPDRQDGGDLARYTQATAAFAELRVPWSRSEAWADQVEKAWAAGYDGLNEEGRPYTDPLPRCRSTPRPACPWSTRSRSSRDCRPGSAVVARCAWPSARSSRPRWPSWQRP
jgi:hypothetical protein